MICVVKTGKLNRKRYTAHGTFINPIDQSLLISHDKYTLDVREYKLLKKN